MSNQSAAEAAFDALGDPNRRRILECLRTGARPVGELARELPIGRPAVSKHLRVLENAGLIEHSARGTRNLYALAPDGLQQVQAWLVGLWDTSLQSFADFVAEQADLQHEPPESTSAESRKLP
jgi:DNA-binding transcriptional ArsR family regulator